MTPDAGAAGFSILRLDAVRSTNDVARTLAEAGREAGLVVVARRQTAGRGRHGRTWQSPAGNLYASLILRPRRSLAESASLSLVMALSLVEALESLAAPRPLPRVQVKWPNDVLIEGAKLAGILLEGSADPDGGCRWLLAGVGVNVTSSPPLDLAGYGTTSLRALGIAVAPEAVLQALLDRLAEHLPRWEADGFGPFRSAWLVRAAGLHGPVRLARGGDRPALQGRLVDIDETGAIRIEQGSGQVVSCAVGELALG